VRTAVERLVHSTVSLALRIDQFFVVVIAAAADLVDSYQQLFRTDAGESGPVPQRSALDFARASQFRFSGSCNIRAHLGQGVQHEEIDQHHLDRHDRVHPGVLRTGRA
jgi:hypothetical protein